MNTLWRRAPAVPESAERWRGAARSIAERRVATMNLADRILSWSGFDAEFSRLLGREGLIGLALPTEYGGGGQSQLARFIVIEEFLAAGAPVAAHWIGERQSAPLILRYGTAEQKASLLPAICRGEIFFCIGMSEPNAGSDLASVSTRARRDGDDWILNGAKIWTTGGCQADYMIALVRTGEGSVRHAGLSQVVIDLTLPGISRRPILDATGSPHFSEIFFDNVRLPAFALIGTEGAGWDQVTAELAFERSGPERFSSTLVLLQAWLDLLRTGDSDSIDRLSLGRFAARFSTMRAMAVAVALEIDRGESPIAAASIVKDLGTSLEQESVAVISAALARRDSRSPSVEAACERLASLAPAFSLRGGTREVLRGIIAKRIAAA